MEPLQQAIHSQYTENERLYGRIKYSDDEVTAKINELQNNGWKFAGLEKCYQGRPQDYEAKFNPIDDHLPTETIEYDWTEVANRIGGLGYAYATSTIYGPKGNPQKRKELRDALPSDTNLYQFRNCGRLRSDGRRKADWQLHR